jgi:transglutaminase-like putative cysteine protease
MSDHKFLRRDILKGGLALSTAAALPMNFAKAENTFAPTPGDWRRFKVVTRIELADPQGRTRAWVPLPAVKEAAWTDALGNEWATNAKTAEVLSDAKYGAQFLHLEWTADEKTPYAEVTSLIATRDRAVDLTKPGTAQPLGAQERKLYTQGTDLIPVDGIVKEYSDKITTGATTDIEKAKAIYEWVVENTYRNASTRGCGIGDIAAMLRTNSLGGKCADINALYVGLVRAAGIPARDVYGLRVAASKFGYKSLGANSETITKAQHCRAEVYFDGFGWVATDPADVRKVMLEEPPGQLKIDDAKVAAARKTLFGAWEGNWLAYNFAHDIALPGAQGPKVEFLMYPQAETAAGRLDCLDPDRFKYVITAREVTGT